MSDEEQATADQSTVTPWERRISEMERDQLQAAKRLLVEASAFMRIFAQDAWIQEAAALVGPLTEHRKGRR